MNHSSDEVEFDAGGNPSTGGANGNSDSGGTTGDAGESGAGGESGSAGSVEGGAGGEGGAGAGGEGGRPLELLTGVAPGCADRSTDDALYPLQPGAWWRHWAYEESDNGARSDKLNYVCEQQPMPRVPGEQAFPVLSLKVGARRTIRWQSLRPCPDTPFGYDIRRHYDERFDQDWNLLSVLHYCPYRLRTVDCLAQAGELPHYESYTEASVATVSPSDGDWSACDAVRIDPDSCEPEGVVPDGCEVVVCPGDDSCMYAPGDHSGEVFQDWQVVTVESQRDVPAGTFFDVEIHTNLDWDGELAHFHWARGVGKVYEHSVGVEWEELVAYCIPDDVHEPSELPLEPDLPDHCPVPNQ